MIKKLPLKVFGMESYAVGNRAILCVNPAFFYMPDDGTKEDLSLPVEDRPFFIVKAHNAVCEECDGSGVTTRHIESDGGGFTSSEWDEVCDGDPEFAENYLSGVYDRPCPECNGERVTLTPDDLSESDPRTAFFIESSQAEAAYQRSKYSEY